MLCEGAPKSSPKLLGMEDERRRADSSDFATLLRRYRLAAGLSQFALAERAQISPRGVSALESGYRRTPQRETLALLSGALALDDEQRRAFEAAARSATSRPRDTSVTLGPWPSTGSSSLPMALTRFIGRETELREIAALLREHRLVTVTGAGGVGKTQTALHVAICSRDDFGGSVYFIGLAPVNDPSFVTRAIASAVGVQEVPNQPLIETLVAFLKNKRALLVLDNCEHLIDQAAFTSREVLTSCPSIRILATSREPLVAAGERRYRLPSLDMIDAATLFVDRAQAVDGRFTLNGENATTVAEICRRLDGIPLALELAAARVNVLPLKAIAEGLGDCLSLLGRGDRTASPRQWTMRAAIEWSYGLLSDYEQRLFERLSVFVGGCTLDSAVLVCGDDDVPRGTVFGLISSLVERSLVVADLDGTASRYRLLEPFRQYARDKLNARGEGHLLNKRHALAQLALAKRFSETLDTAPEPAWQHSVQAEVDDWRAALHWTITNRGDVPSGQLLLGTIPAIDCFPPAEWRQWLDLARRLEGPDTPAEAIAALRHAECHLAHAMNQYELELSWALEARERYRALEDQLGIARSQAYAARALLNMQRAEGEPLARDAVECARRLDLKKQLAFALRVLSMGYFIRQEFSDARRCVAESHSIHVNIGATVSALGDATQFAEIELAAGNHERAVQHMSEALVASRSFGHSRFVEHALQFLALCYVRSGDYDRAKACTREALSLCVEQHFVVATALNLQRLVAIALLRADPSIAMNRAQMATELLGYVDACIAANGRPRAGPDSEEYVGALESLGERMPHETIERLMKEGAAMTEDEAIEKATAL